MKIKIIKTLYNIVLLSLTLAAAMTAFSSMVEKDNVIPVDTEAGAG